MRSSATFKFEIGGEPYKLSIDNVRPASKAAVKKGSAEIVADVTFEREAYHNHAHDAHYKAEVLYEGELYDNNLTIPGVGVFGMDPYSFVCFGDEKKDQCWLVELYQDTMTVFVYSIDFDECPDGNGAI
jgi:hypothetical protein